MPVAVFILNESEAVAFYKHRKPLKLTSDRDIENFVSWFLSDSKSSLQTEVGLKAVGFQNIEDTQEIKVA